MKKLRLMKVKDEMLEGKWAKYYEQHRGKVYIFFGEFAHAPGHCLLLDFDTFQFYPYMCHTDEFEFLERHPDDVVIEL
jgi:hypothetical protein